MSRSEFWLTWLLRLNALILCSAFFAILTPTTWMEWIHQWLGMGEFPDRPITQYLTRSLSALYAVHGVLLMAIAWRPRRFWNLIPVVAVAHMSLGAVLTVIDLQVRMPWFWTAAEGPPVALYGAVIFWLWTWANRGESSDTN